MPDKTVVADPTSRFLLLSSFFLLYPLRPEKENSIYLFATPVLAFPLFPPLFSILLKVPKREPVFLPSFLKGKRRLPPLIR